MTHLKRIIALALCLALVLALSACGGDTPSAQESENPSGLVWTADYAELSLDSNIQYVNRLRFCRRQALYLRTDLNEGDI